MKRKIKVKRILESTLFRLLGIGFLFSVLPLSIFFGILALFEIPIFEVRLNGQVLTGISGLIGTVFGGLVFVLVSTILCGTLLSFGLGVYSAFSPITITYIATEGED